MKISIFLFIFLPGFATLKGQSFSVALNLQKATEYEVKQQITSKVTVNMEGKLMVNNMDITITQDFLVVDSSAIGYTLALVFNGILTKNTNLFVGTNYVLNTHLGSGFENMPDDFDKELKLLKGLKYEVTIDKKGNLISAKGFEKILGWDKQKRSLFSSILGFDVSDSSIIKHALAGFKIANKTTLSQNEVWQEVSIINNKVCTQEATVTAVNDDAFTVLEKGAFIINDTIEANDIKSFLTGESNSTVTSTFDKKSGLLNYSVGNYAQNVVYQNNLVKYPQIADSKIEVFVKMK